MATKRGGVYYTDRRLPIIGRLNRSLQTRDPKTARHREHLIMRLADTERFDVLEALRDGKIDVVQLSHAWGKGPGALTALLETSGDKGVLEVRDAFIRAKGAEIKTAERYAYSLHALEQWRPGIRISHLVDSKTVNEFKRHRLTEGRSTDTVSRDLAAIHQLLVWHGGKKLARRAFEGVKWPKQAPRRTRRLSPDEIQKLISIATQTRRMYGDIFYVMLATGLRPSEVLRIRQQDVNEQAMVLYVEDSKTAAGQRIVPITDRGVIDRIRAGGKTVAFPIPQTRLGAAFRRIARKAGLKDIKLRDLRRSHAQYCRLAEKDIVKARDQLGHASVRNTEAYVGQSTAEERRGMVETALALMGLTADVTAPEGVPRD